VTDQPRRLCIITSDELLRSGEFIAALGASLRIRPQESHEIILDRRRSGSLMEASRADRRRQPRVEFALATKGFAIVSAPVDHGEDRPGALSREEAEEDRKRLEDILSFQRRRSARLLTKLGAAFPKSFRVTPKIVEPLRTLPILTKLLAVSFGVVLATFTLSPAGQNLWKSLISRGFEKVPPTSGSPAAAPPAAQVPSALAHAPTVDKTPAVPETQPAAGGPAASQETSPPPKAAGTTATPREPAAKARATRASTKETGTPKARPPRLAGTLRAELAREPITVARGESYAVRLLNSAGQPMAGSDVWLVARRADGTVESIPMGALPELGTYRATVPTGRSAPINLQVRLRIGEKRVEVPLKP
jgi:hypothetical protein